MVATREFKPSLRSLSKAVAHDVPRAKFDIWFGRCAAALALACGAWIVFELAAGAGPRVLEASIAGLIVAGIACLAILWVLPRLVQRSRSSKATLTRRRYKFDAEALVLETADGEAVRTPYRSFRKICAGPGHIAFYEMFPGYPAHVIRSDASAHAT